MQHETTVRAGAIGPGKHSPSLRLSAYGPAHLLGWCQWSTQAVVSKPRRTDGAPENRHMRPAAARWGGGSWIRPDRDPEPSAGRFRVSRFEIRIERKIGQTRSEPGARLRRTAAGARRCAQRMCLHGFAGETRARERKDACRGRRGNRVLTRAGRTIRKGKIYDSSRVMTRPTITRRQKCEV